MSDIDHNAWLEANQRWLMAALALVRRVLERQAGEDVSGNDDDLHDALNAAAAGLPAPSALDVLCARFALSSFERDLLLLCAGMELDSRFARLCAAAHGDPSRPWPTFSLAMTALRDPVWSALTPAAPLRHWRMIEVGSAAALTTAPLRIDERMLHYLVGAQHIDDRLAGIVEAAGPETDMVPSHAALAERIARTWARAAEQGHWPVMQLAGDEPVAKRGIAAAAASALGMGLCSIGAHAVPAIPAELEALARLWEREWLLGGTALLIDCDDTELSEPGRAAAVLRFAGRVGGMVMISSRNRLPGLRRSAVTFDVRRPAAEEQGELWHALLGADAPALNGEIGRLVSQFNLGAAAIRSAFIGSPAPDDLWDACRGQARPSLENLAQRIEPMAGWDDLVLPEPQLRVLRRMAMHLRNRHTVYRMWGFAGRSARGLGLSALFAGASGTGKTLAAEVLARELRLDLFRIDLSSVVSKYIGETEKNLGRLFDAAEDGGAILFFDEADALFGRRTEVKDSHDRYANIEVSYLLQRMESYRGLAILTSNMKAALDTAFLRRIRFIVEFPFPDAKHRMEIWRRAFPHATPTDGLDLSRLARLNIAGGNISNIALGAAFLAAEAGESITMKHLLEATRDEYAKLEKPLTDAETREWG